MNLPVCKCCGQTLPGALDLNGVRLTPQQMSIVKALQRAGENGLTIYDLVDRVYGADPNGGPDAAVKVIHVQIMFARRRLKPVNLEILCDSYGPGATYRMVRHVAG